MWKPEYSKKPVLSADATTVRAPNSNLERKCRVRNKQGWATSSIELAATESICIECAHDEGIASIRK